MSRILLPLIAAFAVALPALAEIDGSVILFPKGCENTDARKCKLAAELRYTDPRNVVWESSVWHNSNQQSGTTDGASIPLWAQPIIGLPYDSQYLKAAIIHDHYCYKENHVRPWRATHRMFYDALIDLGIPTAKAKAMYFAVYLAGPKWVELVPGEPCGNNCIKNFSLTEERVDSNSYDNPIFQDEIVRIYSRLLAGENLSVKQLEEEAKSLRPNFFFYKHGWSYSPTGSTDPLALPAQ